MTPRARRRRLVLLSSPGRQASLPGASTLARAPGRRWGRRQIRLGILLAVVGLRGIARIVRPRWRPLLAGGACMTAGLMLHGGILGALVLPGCLLLYAAVLVPGRQDPGRAVQPELERELAGCATTAERRDLAATLKRYPDSVSFDLREILAGHSMAARDQLIPAGAGRLRWSTPQSPRASF